MVMASTGHYKGTLYAAYDKNHKERDRWDYYSTPAAETLNILKTLDIDFSNQSILEPCVGGGHMATAIEEYCNEKGCANVKLIGSDIKDRGWTADNWELTYGLDFFADDYPNYKADWVIMNPPYGVIEPFTIRALEIAEKGLVMLARLQFLEGKGRYEKIFEENPPTDVYVYVDRICCHKNGEIQQNEAKIQCYAWFLFDKRKTTKETQLHWIRRAE